MRTGDFIDERLILLGQLNVEVLYANLFGPFYLKLRKRRK